MLAEFESDYKIWNSSIMEGIEGWTWATVLTFVRCFCGCGFYSFPCTLYALECLFHVIPNTIIAMFKNQRWSVSHITFLLVIPHLTQSELWKWELISSCKPHLIDLHNSDCAQVWMLHPFAIIFQYNETICWTQICFLWWSSCKIWKHNTTQPSLVRVCRSVPGGFGALCHHCNWFTAPSSSYRDSLQRADPPYWADNLLSAVLHKIAAWHWRWGKRTGWYTANQALSGSYSFLKLYSYRWCQCISMKTTCHLRSFFPELSQYFLKPFFASHNLDF